MSLVVLFRRRPSNGFTLIELLIGLALGVLVAAVATSVFIMNARVREATDSLSRLQEGARVAFELIARDVRQTGGFSCGREAGTGDSGSRGGAADYRFSNALLNANTVWWSTWTAPLPTTDARGGFRGYGPADVTLGTAFGTATGNRVAGTSAIDVRYAGTRAFDGAFLAPAVVATNAARITLNVPATGASGHGFQTGDLVVVCANALPPVGSGNPVVQGQDQRDFVPWVALGQVSVAGSELTLAYIGLTPGNRNATLWDPAPVWAPAARAQPRVQVAPYIPVRWYVGINARNGRSLFRETLSAGNSPRVIREEMIEGVTDLRIDYAIDGGADFVGSAAVVDWAAVTAVRMTVVMDTAQGGVGTEGQRVSADFDALERDFTNVIAIRSRLP
ncbi:MAG TPA: hypothetical protein DCM32_07670 [Xanthomonadaceae bacterium]|nr:hypothetical protein [Xanthomonadaceae bacterium]